MNYNRLDVPMFSDKQSMKDLKKVTPDNKFKSKDVVYVNCLSLIQDIKLEGDFIFDSYDSYDNTAFIYKQFPGMTYKVLLSDLTLKETKNV